MAFIRLSRGFPKRSWSVCGINRHWWIFVRVKTTLKMPHVIIQKKKILDEPSEGCEREGASFGSEVKSIHKVDVSLIPSKMGEDRLNHKLVIMKLWYKLDGQRCYYSVEHTILKLHIQYQGRGNTVSEIHQGDQSE